MRGVEGEEGLLPSRWHETVASVTRPRHDCPPVADWQRSTSGGLVKASLLWDPSTSEDDQSETELRSLEASAPRGQLRRLN